MPFEQKPKMEKRLADYALTNPLRPYALAGGMSVALFSFSALILFVTLRTPALRSSTDPLAIYAFGVVVTWTWVVVAMLVRPPSPEQAVIVWGRTTNILIWSLHLAVVWLIWGVLPKVSLTDQFFATAFLIAYAPAQIISSPESTRANRAGIILVLGSTAVFLATRHVLAASLLASYVVSFGVLMYVLSDKILRTVNATVSQRLASEAYALELDRLLKSVSAERDAKTRFIAAASHDLGQPLQAAALFFDQSLRAKDPDARLRAVDGVHRALSSAEQLLAHMLNHLRLEADEVVPQMSPVRLSSLLGDLAAQYAPTASRANLTISKASGDLILSLDPTLIERAVGNLIQNAVDHSHGTRILLAARRHGNGAIRLWVIDNGLGISRADARRIFEDYYQGPRPAGSVPSGFGLGLSSVRRITHILGGSTGLDPRWQRGCAFYIEIPSGSDSNISQSRTRKTR